MSARIVTETKPTHTSPEAEAAKVQFGFWLYLMTDCILFACLFATYFVLHANTFGGPGSRELFGLPLVLTETLLLLTSSFSCGLAGVAAGAGRARAALSWLAVTGGLGLAFLGFELHEFISLIKDGNGPDRSGFLSAFFTLVGTHGVHITVGLIWLSALMFYVVRRGLTPLGVKRLSLFTMFWHFLDLIWIFIFSMVYLVGVL